MPFLTLGQGCPGTESAGLVKRGLPLFGPGRHKEGDEEVGATYHDDRKKAKKEWTRLTVARATGGWHRQDPSERTDRWYRSNQVKLI